MDTFQYLNYSIDILIKEISLEENYNENITTKSPEDNEIYINMKNNDTLDEFNSVIKYHDFENNIISSNNILLQILEFGFKNINNIKLELTENINNINLNFINDHIFSEFNINIYLKKNL